MAGRALAFSDRAIIETIRERFVPAAGDDWYRRRQQDPVGRFYRKVALQRGGWDGDSTRQGLYCLTASGKLLAYRNTSSPEHVKRLLDDALERWRALDESERRPRELDPGEAAATDSEDRRYARPVPDGALVIRVHARELDRKPDGTFCKAPPRDRFQNLGSLDHLWIRDEEWRRLAPPAGAEVGTTYALDPEIAHRIARFHLVDNTRGEPPFWARHEVRRLELALEVVSLEHDVVRLTLGGDAHLGTRRGDRGYTPRLAGTLEYDRSSKRFTRFDVVAVGDHWGRGRYTPHERPGKAPLGIAFVLADGSTAADRVPPQAARDIDLYFAAR